MVYAMVFLTTFDMLGILWIWNSIAGGYEVQINAVSVVNLITTVGLSVEFNVHIMLKFSRAKGTRLQRAKEVKFSVISIDV
jgi:Niemann-Pick C1 protein